MNYNLFSLPALKQSKYQINNLNKKKQFPSYTNMYQSAPFVKPNNPISYKQYNFKSNVLAQKTPSSLQFQVKPLSKRTRTTMESINNSVQIEFLPNFNPK